MLNLDEMTKKWSHLPSAEHIDWVLETLEKNPKVWVAARVATRHAAGDAAWVAAWTAFGAAWTARAARDAAWKDMWDAAWGATAALVARGAIAALIAWDNSAELLDMSVEEVTELANEGNHAAVLLLPAVIVKNKLKENTKLNKPRLFLDEGAWCALLGDNI